jgi:chromosome segregation ATPase
MKRIFVSSVATLFMLVMLMACASDKKPAELAMQAAEQAVNAAKAEAVKLVPDQAAALEAALASAKEKMAKKEYKEALAEAQALPAKTQEVVAAAKAKKEELTKKWTELTQEFPQMVEAIQGKVDSLDKLKKLPKDMTAEKLAEVKTGLDAIKADWAKAQESFKSGNIADGLAAAATIKEKGVKAMEALGIAPAPAAPAVPEVPAAPAAPAPAKK